MKKRNKFISTLAAAAMVAVMAGATLPTTALAEETNDALPLSKNVELQSDGTYTLTLSAYATGELKITEEKVPLDIVLVLDQSGSMADPFEYKYDVSYEQFKGSYWESYSTPVYHKADDGNYHELNVTREWKVLGYKYSYDCEYCNIHIGANRCFLAGFTQSPKTDPNWGNQILTKQTTSKEVSRLEALQEAAKSFITNVRTDATENNLKHRIAVVGFASESGYGNNTEILTVNGSNTNIDDRNTIGVAYKDLTDTNKRQALVSMDNKIIDQAIDNLAASGATRADLGMEMAKDILSSNKQGGRKQVVIMFTDGSPTSSNGFEKDVANQAIEYSKVMKDAGVDVYTVGIFEDANGDESINSATSNENKFMHATSSNYLQATNMDDVGTLNKLGYYMSAKNANQLKEVFNAISQSVTGSTTVTLGSESVLKDIISNDFKLPDNATAEGNITAKVADYQGDGNFSEPKLDNNLKVNLSDDKKTITVSGFSYKDNYVADGVNGSAPTGKKLIVTIKGLEAQPTAATGSPVDTNADGSGIYENSKLVTPVKKFVSPTVIIPKESYVLDYAKTATLPTDDNFNRTNVQTNMAKINESLGNKLTLNYGNVDFENQSLKYTPTQMNWNGYDTFYTFGNKDSKIDWHQINVIPANNVYYEDDFVTTSTDGGKTGTVGIVYSGKDWETDGTSGGNTANTDSHGEWVPGDSRANDGTYSDGSAHKGSAGATASFSFTGTGVDIYSRTDMMTGTVVAQLKSEEPGNTVNKLYIVDNYSDDKDENNNAVPYYQIPTVTFGNLNYGKYTVTITVTSAAKDRSTYYLDGIRVYNPLGKDSEELDETVKEAYGPNELNATFMEVRTKLLEAGTLSEDNAVDGVVYIDQTGDGSQETNNIATYKKDGPKDEVYLSTNQAIAFAVDDPNATYYIGLKGPQGETRAEISNGSNKSTPQITSASDLYYKVVPYSGTDTEGNATHFIMVKNTGDNLLSVTKLRVTGSDPAVSEAPATTSFSLSAMRSYINTFDTLETVAYTAAPEDAEESEETPEVTEPDNTEGETSEIVPPEDVVIENPEPAEPEQPAVSPIRKILNKIFNGFRGLFQR